MSIICCNFPLIWIFNEAKGRSVQSGTIYIMKYALSNVNWITGKKITYCNSNFQPGLWLHNRIIWRRRTVRLSPRTNETQYTHSILIKYLKRERDARVIISNVPTTPNVELRLTCFIDFYIEKSFLHSVAEKVKFTARSLDETFKILFSHKKPRHKPVWRWEGIFKIIKEEWMKWKINLLLYM